MRPTQTLKRAQANPEYPVTQGRACDSLTKKVTQCRKGKRV